jgi:oligopeptide transport system substrate-binding protein
MMKKLLVALLLVTMVLTGCTQPDNAYRNAYTYVYTADISQLDYLTAYEQTNAQHTTNFVDGLVEHNPLGQLVGAIATSWESNADKTVWTFKIRKNVKWVTVDGEVAATVKADDWVAGLQHGADFESETAYILFGVIKNYSQYFNGEITDFSEVGVKALDANTLEYTLEAPTPYFDTMFSYGVLGGVNREFLEGQGAGCKLGDPDPSTCNFGSTEASSILYNGAYLLSNNTAASVIEYVQNPTYWDKKHVYIPSVKLIFFDGADKYSLYRAFDNGEYVAAPVYTDDPAFYEAAVAKYGDSIYVGRLNTTTYYITFNYNRRAFENFDDGDAETPAALVSGKTDAQKEATKAAILNENFRKAIFRGINRAELNKQGVGETLKANALRNTYTAPLFVSTSDGKSYADLVSAELTKISATDFPAGFDLSDSQDPYYNLTLAKSLMAAAKAELSAVEWPIVIDVNASLGGVNIATRLAFKQMMEDAFPGDVVVEIHYATSTAEYLSSFYYTENAEQQNYDINLGSGWGPDYGDPKTYVNTLNPDNGDLLKSFGLLNGLTSDVDVKTAAGFLAFGDLNEAANVILTDMDARYAAYAAAEAYLIGHAIILPNVSQGGNYAVSRILPYSGSYADYGTSGDKYKFLQVTDHVITAAERATAKAEWEAARAK